MARALDRILECAMSVHEADRDLQILFRHVALLERAPPEHALTLRAAAIAQDYRQRDLAVAEIVADVLAELRGFSTIVERVVDELEGNAEIHPERTARRLFRLRPRREHGPDFAGRREQLGGLGADHREILVLRCRGVLGGGEL